MRFDPNSPVTRLAVGDPQGPRRMALTSNPVSASRAHRAAGSSGPRETSTLLVFGLLLWLLVPALLRVVAGCK